MKTRWKSRTHRSALLKELELDCDHVHLLVSNQPHLSPAQIVRRLKMERTKRIWREHPELEQEFWKKKIF